MRASTRLLIKIATASCCAAALAACGSNRSITVTHAHGAKPKPPPHNSHTVWVYSSLPLQGSQRQESNAIIDGIRLALHQVDGHVSAYSIKYTPLDDSGRSGWKPGLVVRNAQRAARDPHTVAYIGDLNSGATELSLPIVNQAGIVQITPGSGYPGLTNSLPPVTSQGEPLKFYPTHQFTLLRLIPDDMVQAAAILELLHSTGCDHVAAASLDGGVDGQALVKAVRLTAKEYGGIGYVAAPPPGTKTSAYPTYARNLRDAGVGCFVLAGHVTPAAVALTQQIHAELPTGAIIGSSGFCSRAWTDPARHGVSAAVDPYLYCTSPLPPPSKYPVFIADFRRVYHRTPGAYSLIGYRAAEVVLDGVYNLRSGRDNRKAVLGALIGGVGHPSPVAGSYAFDSRGNLTTHAYAIYHVVNGRPIYDKTLTPSRVL